MHEIGERALGIDDPWDALATYITDRRDLHYREPAAVDALLMTYPESAELVALAEAATRTATELIRRAHAAAVLRPDFPTGDLYYADVGNGLALRRLPKPSPEDHDRRTRFFLDGLRPR